MPDPQSPSPLQVNASFTSGELHLLKQGVTKSISESRTHSLAISAGPLNSIEDTAAILLEYYTKRINVLMSLMTKIEMLQLELDTKQKQSVAHNL